MKLGFLNLKKIENQEQTVLKKVRWLMKKKGRKGKSIKLNTKTRLINWLKSVTGVGGKNKKDLNKINIFVLLALLSIVFIYIKLLKSRSK